jgi:HAMP domain-containing protein
VRRFLFINHGVVPILAAILAVVLFAASRTVTKDVERLQSWMREG